MAVQPPTAKGGGAKTPPPVAQGSPAGVPAGNPPSSSAVETAAKHGGLAGGKKRSDGLVPGSPEAQAADRKKDADRKRAARAVAEKLKPEPAALPPSVPGAAQPQANGAAPLSPGGTPQTIVPWAAETLKPLVEKLLEAAEEGRVAAFAAKTKQLGDMPKLIKEINEDAHFPTAAKVLLATALPRLAAKWLNHSGISAEYQDEISVITAILLIYKHDRTMSAKLDKLIAEQKKAREPKQPEKKEEPQKISAPVAAPAAAEASGPQLSNEQKIATIKI